MAKKQTALKSMEDFIKVYASLSGRADWSLKRPWLLVAMEVARTGNPKVVFDEKTMVQKNIVSEHSGDFLEWCSDSVDPFKGKKLCVGQPVFEDYGGGRTYRMLVVNSRINHKKAFFGLDLIPEKFLELKVYVPQEKVLDLAVAAVVLGRDHLKELVTEGRFLMPLKIISIIAGGAFSTKVAYSNAITKINKYASETGLRMALHVPNRASLEDFVEKGFVEVFFEGNLLVNYLSKYGLVPVVKEPVTEQPKFSLELPEKGTEAQQLKLDRINRFENMTDSEIFADIREGLSVLERRQQIFENSRKVAQA